MPWADGSDITSGALNNLGNILHNASAYGATGDGATDDTSALSSALSAAGANLADGNVSRVLVPKGTYQITDTLLVPPSVTLEGFGRGTRIRADSTFSSTWSTNEYMFRLGDGTSAAFNCALENVMVECNGVAGVGGVYSSDVQDQSGLRNVLINNWRNYGVRFDGGGGTFGSVNRFMLEDVEVLKANADSGTGVGISIKDGTFPGTMNGISVVANSAAPGAAGIESTNFQLVASQIAIEQMADGILIGTAGSASQGCVINGVMSLGCDNTVRITTPGRVVLLGVRQSTGTTTIADNASAVTITSSVWPFYAKGEYAQSTDGFIVGGAALAQGATSGFLHIPTYDAAGAPSGTPQSHHSTVPIVYNEQTDSLHIYNEASAAWSGVSLS